MTDTIIFDLDGTLLDTLDDLYASVNHSLEQNDFPQRGKAEIRSFLGNGAKELIRLSLPDGCSNAIVEKTLKSFRDYYSVHSMDQTRPYNGILPMLEALKSEGYKTAIVSNKPDFAVEQLFRRFFSNYIDIAIGENEGISRKPSPDMLNKALDILGSTTAQSIYVGDSEVDIATALNSGVRCISVSWGFRDRDYLKAKGAEIIIDSPMELINETRNNLIL